MDMNILLAITGYIAAYKAPDIARGLVSQGHTVRVICSHGALKFINKDVFKHLGVEETYLDTDDFNHKQVLHIDLSKWADSFVIAPLSANFLSKLAQGQCSGLIESVFLSLSKDKIKILVPAMNPTMLSNPITQRNLNVLKTLSNVVIIDSDFGVLACGDTGKGKLPKVEALTEVIPLIKNNLTHSRVVITAGATLSSIDPVRYVSNPAKGGTAYVIAKKYLSEGYSVHVIKGVDSTKKFEHLKKHPRYSEEVVITTPDLLTAVKNRIKNFEIYISPMAVSDIECEYTDSKLKKSSMTGSFKYKQADDVLKYVIENKTKSAQVVGFAAESSLDESVINEKLKRKPVDLLIANLASSGYVKGSQKQGFGTSQGHYKIVDKNETKEFESLDKEELADLIYEKIK
jgi:phosphopantothenoylcysteine decarboxylase / phosphopantothenate---cysteine ligase